MCDYKEVHFSWGHVRHTVKNRLQWYANTRKRCPTNITHDYVDQTKTSFGNHRCLLLLEGNGTTRGSAVGLEVHLHHLESTYLRHH